MNRHLGLAVIAASLGCGTPVGETPDAGAAPRPYYFIAVHNEPANLVTGTGEQKIAANYPYLQQMVAKANEVHVKLTLMLSAQWADYILKDAGRQAEVLSWKDQGHELSGHHHGVHHGNWDGYTDLTESEADALRVQQGKTPEPYHGTLADYLSRLHALDPDIKSGCMNDEVSRTELPAGIVYSTCSGFTNHLDPGAREDDGVAEKGINTFANVGTWNGIQRSWLAHAQITNSQSRQKAQTVLGGLTSGVYGAVLHSSQSETTELLAWLDYVHQLDPAGARSRTLSEVIEQRLLPESALTDTQLSVEYPRTTVQGKCGDGFCDAVEQANPNLCPGDCP
jgi:hypothetical protein